MSDVLDMDWFDRTFESMFRPKGADKDDTNNNDQGDQSSPKDKANESD